MPGPYWCIRLTTRPRKNRLCRLPPRKVYDVYFTRSTYHYAYARQPQVSWKQEIRKKELRERKDRKPKKKIAKEHASSTSADWGNSRARLYCCSVTDHTNSLPRLWFEKIKWLSQTQLFHRPVDKPIAATEHRNHPKHRG